MERDVTVEEAADLLKGKIVRTLNWGEEAFDDNEVCWNGFGIFFEDDTFLTIAVSDTGGIQLRLED